MDHLKSFKFTVAFLLINLFATAQNFQWLKVTTSSKNGLYVNSISAEPSGCTYLVVLDSSYNPTKIKDTIRFDTFSFIHNRGNASFFVRVDSIGKVFQARSIGSFYTHSICRDANENFYISGGLTPSCFVDSIHLSSLNGNIVFAKFDKDFNFIWASQTGNSFSSQRPSIMFSGNHLYFVLSTSGLSKIGNTTYSLGSGYTSIYGEVNPQNGIITWSKFFIDNLAKNSTNLFLNEVTYLKGKLFISGFLNDSNVIVSSDTLFGPGGVVIETDTLGNYQSRFSLHNKKNTKISCLVTDGEFLYIGGVFRDTLLWNNQRIIAEESYQGKMFIASLTISLKPRWFYRPKIPPYNNGGSRVYIMRVSNSFIYCGGDFSGKLLMDSNILSGNHDVFLFKADRLGNILWATSGGSSGYVWSMDAGGNKAVYAGGMFVNTKYIKFGKHLDSSKNTRNSSAWITKISDYDITRGKVIAGPYCAGDTIKVPYSKLGDFDTSNRFIAQLSNEYGNFDSSFRELGRIKSNTDGIIIGRLPSFSVASSNLYRIRIISTKPAVQSYYVADTLRLLIYSRDKANPGPAESICRGDTIQLNTYGGTKWTWSPNYNMDNSNFRQPKVWPSKDTIYQIVIADSSGCGAPDTAYKKISMRPALKVNLNFKDSSVCSNTPILIPVSFSGGDTNGYSFKWYYVYTPKSWFSLKSGQGVLKDTFAFTPTDPIEKLAIVLTDGCTKLNDTSYITFRLRSSVKISTLFSDTVICHGNKINFKSKALGGIPKYYQWTWKDISSNTVLSNKDTLLFNANQSTKMEVTVNDGCVDLGDTSKFNIVVNPPLKASILYAYGTLSDTTLCYGKNIKLYSIGRGGLGSGYNFRWKLDNNLLSIIDTFNLVTSSMFRASGETKTLKLVLQDNCTNGADSVLRIIKTVPGPKSDFTWGKSCNKTKIPFSFTGSQAAFPVSTRFTWFYPDGDSSNAQNPSKVLSTIGINKVSLKLTSSNGCFDALSKDVEVKQEAIADFTANDVCEDSSVIFNNTSQDGVSYDWKFGDGLNSTNQSPKHKYIISGVTSTFNVVMAALVPNGCSDTTIKAVTVNANPKSGFTFTTGGNLVNFTAAEANGTNYNWTFGDGGTINTVDQKTSYNYNKFPSGKYTACLKVSNIAGCVAESCKEINISGATSLSLTKMGVKIYPNPNNGSFTLDIEEAKGEILIEVYDPIGKMIYQKQSTQSSIFVNLDLSKGCYLLRVINKGESYNQKIFIQ